MPKQEFGKTMFGGGAADDLDITHDQVNSHLMKLKAKEGEQIVAKPILIDDIKADPTQPRRAIPASLRGSWNGNPSEVPALLELWEARVNKTLGYKINIADILQNGGEGFDIPDNAPIVTDFVDLIALAGSIHRNKLVNAITVWQNGGTFVIETGERRWLAHHLLKNYVDKVKYSKIAAHVVSETTVWRQAEENGARKPLNAIGMARQFALLIMDMYKDDDGVKFQSYSAMIEAGKTEREFYAQVENGVQWRVKRGFTQSILDATGLKHKNQLSQYRNLLTIPDDLWIQADEESWTEFKIRGIMDEIQGTNRSGLNTDMSPTGDLSTTSPFPSRPASAPTPQPPAPQLEHFDDDDDDGYSDGDETVKLTKTGEPVEQPDTPAAPASAVPRRDGPWRESSVPTSQQLRDAEQLINSPQGRAVHSWLMFIRATAASVDGFERLHADVDDLLKMDRNKIAMMIDTNDFTEFVNWLFKIQEITGNLINGHLFPVMNDYFNHLWEIGKEIAGEDE